MRPDMGSLSTKRRDCGEESEAWAWGRRGASSACLGSFNLLREHEKTVSTPVAQPEMASGKCPVGC